MEKFDVFKDEKNRVTNFVLKFEEAVKKIPVINFNETSIEFPNMVVFTKEDKGLIYSMLNPGVEVFKVDEESFAEMKKVVEAEEEGVLFLDKKVSPKTTGRVNLNLLADSAVYLRESADTFICNEVLFTTSETEFQGTGMFTGRNHVFWIEIEDFDLVRKTIKG